jgi:hypothetical protein
MKVWAGRDILSKSSRPSVQQMHQPMNRPVVGRSEVWFVVLDAGNSVVVQSWKSVKNSWSYEPAEIFVQNPVDQVSTKCTNRWTGPVVGRSEVWCIVLDGGNSVVVQSWKSVKNSWSYEPAEKFIQNPVDQVSTKCTNRWTDRSSAGPRYNL